MVPLRKGCRANPPACSLPLGSPPRLIIVFCGCLRGNMYRDEKSSGDSYGLLRIPSLSLNKITAINHTESNVNKLFY